MTTPRDSYTWNYRELATLLTLSDSLVEVGLEPLTIGSIQWCGGVVKVQCFESCEVYSRGFESPLLEPLTTSQQPTQLPILPRSVHEYSEVILRAQAVMPQAHISSIAATYPACVNKEKLLCFAQESYYRAIILSYTVCKPGLPSFHEDTWIHAELDRIYL